ncbi:Piso0_002479 [Millerozyma farinosa CBS 7064]|uniref:Guanine nucleotide-exchange factor SEC12 n=1 Tax=Pichia sorbitophila (strain ATCC MYA-4447 / BCRC 22081 / CBS 7064 / NBRC 10061 / NRRL Y-12695) TaxID=559304 RepID=G8YCQ6_PICSO|nr:Piso0_002479 [Millerozyma farinosa CBS 7064]
MSTKESVTIDLGYPIYATKFIDSKTIIATGGGGQGNNGIPNKITAVKCSFKVADSKKRLQKYREIVLPKNEDSPMCLDIAENGGGGEEGHSVFIGCNQSTELLKSMSINNNLRKYNFSTGEHLRFVDAAQLEENLSIDNKGDYPRIIRLSSHCSLGCLMTSHYPSVIYVFNPELLELNFKYKPKEDVEILDFHLSPHDDGKTLCYITSSSIETISTITSNHLSSSNSNPGTKKEFSSVNLSKVRYVDNSNVIITASLKNGKGVCIYKYSVSEQSIISKCVISKKIRSITAFDISVRQDLIALAGNDTSVTLVKLSNFKVLKTFKQLHTFAITGVSFSPNGSKLASVSAANTLHVMKIPHNYSSGRSVVGSIFHYITLSLFVLIIGLVLQKGYENGQLLEAIELSKEYSQIGTAKAIEFSKVFYSTLKEKIQGENVDGSEMSKYFHMDDWDGTKSFSRPQVSTTSSLTVPSYSSSSSLNVESTSSANHETDSPGSNSPRETSQAETKKDSDDASSSMDAITSSNYATKEENANHVSSSTDGVTRSGSDISSSADASLEGESYDNSSEKGHTSSDVADGFTQSQPTESPSPEVPDTSSLYDTASTDTKSEHATSSNVLPTESSVSENTDDAEATQAETGEAETAESKHDEPEVDEEESDIGNTEDGDDTHSDEITGSPESEEHIDKDYDASGNEDQEPDNAVINEYPEGEVVDEVEDESDSSEPTTPEEHENIGEILSEQEKSEGEEPIPVSENSEDVGEEIGNVQEESQNENLSEKDATADDDDESHYDLNWLGRYRLNSDSDDDSDDEIETYPTSSTESAHSASVETPQTSSSSQIDDKLGTEDVSEPKSQSAPSSTNSGSYDTQSISSTSAASTSAETEVPEVSSLDSSHIASTQLSTPNKAERYSGTTKQQRSSLYSRSNSKSRNTASSSNTHKSRSSSKTSSDKPTTSSAPPKSAPTYVSDKDNDKSALHSASSRTEKMPLRSKTGTKNTSSKKPVKLVSKETPSPTIVPATDKPVTSMISSESQQGTPKNNNHVKKGSKARSKSSLKRSKKKNSGRKISSISRKSSSATHPAHDEL